MVFVCGIRDGVCVWNKGGQGKRGSVVIVETTCGLKTSGLGLLY